jgi:hypothetical protein
MKFSSATLPERRGKSRRGEICASLSTPPMPNWSLIELSAGASFYVWHRQLIDGKVEERRLKVEVIEN